MLQSSVTTSIVSTFSPAVQIVVMPNGTRTLTAPKRVQQSGFVNPFRQMLVPAESRQSYWNISAKESTANLVDCGRSLCTCLGDNHRVGPSCRLLLELPLPKLVLVPFQALLEGVPAPGPEPVAPKPVLVLHTFHNQPPPGLEGVPAPGSSCRLTGWKLSHDPGKRARQRPLAQEERSS